MNHLTADSDVGDVTAVKEGKMRIRELLFVMLSCGTMCLFLQPAAAQTDAPANKDAGVPPVAAEQVAPDGISKSSDTAAPATSDAESAAVEKARDLAGKTQAKVEEIAQQVDQNPRAKLAAEGILGKIYLFAEALSFPTFHWLAFSLMAAGLVSYALQLMLGKLVVLFKGSFNLREILSDLIGFVISGVGLILTTQAAAENSTFTHSPAAVLSSAAFGIIVGFTLYRWGQAQEIQAVAGRRTAAKADAGSDAKR